MKTKFLLLILLTSFTRMVGICSGHQVQSVTASSTSIDRYGLLELTILLSGGDFINPFNPNEIISNPYDPNVIDLECEITNPDGLTISVPAFFFIEFVNNQYTCADDKIYDHLSPTGISCWKVRFTPTLPGVYTYRIRLHENQNYCTLFPTNGSFTFECINNNNPGFVSLSMNGYLQFDDNKPFYPIGSNFVWPRYHWGNSPNGWIDPFQCLELGYTEHNKRLDTFAQNNINFNRIVIDLYGHINIMGLDEEDWINYYNTFNQKDSWKLDRIIEHSEDIGIYFFMTLFNHGNFTDYFDTATHTVIPTSWTNYNPYNQNCVVASVSGNGNLQNPYEFCDISLAHQSQVRNYFRYVISRWGYSTHIISWELFGEMNNFDPYEAPKYMIANLSDNIKKWHTMSKEYINSIDVHKHLVHTSFQNIGEGFTSTIQEMDFGTYHAYGNYLNQDYLDDVYYTARNFIDNVSKPVVLNEYGYFPDKSDVFLQYSKDRHLYGVHTMLWSTFFMGMISPGFFWYDKVYDYDNVNCFPIFNGVSKFFSKFQPLHSKYNSYLNNNNYKKKVVYLANLDRTEFFGWAQDTNFYFKHLLHYAPLYLETNDLSDKPDLASENPSDWYLSLPITNTARYEVKLYNSRTGELVNINYFTPDPQTNQLKFLLPPTFLDEVYGDVVFKISCNPTVGWVESQTAPYQYHEVLSGSNLVTRNGANHIYYVSNHNKVCELWKDLSEWKDADLLQSAQNVINGTSLMYNNFNNSIYYIGTDNFIYRLYINNSSWVNEKASQFQYVPADNYSELVSNSTGSKIFYVSNQHRVCELYFNSNDQLWYNSELLISGALSITDCNAKGLVYNSQDSSIYYVSQFSKIVKLKIINGIWVAENACPSQWHNVRPDSKLKITPAGNHIYYIDENGMICLIWRNGLIWDDSNTNLNIVPVKSGSDFDIRVISGLHEVYFINNNSLIDKLFVENNAWTYLHLLNDQTCQELAKNSLLVYNDEIFYDGISSNKIHNLKLIYEDTTILDTSSNLQESNNEKIKIYPNPSKGEFNIDLSSFQYCKHVLIKIYNLTQQCVFEKESISCSEVINLTKLSKGIYIIAIQSDDEIIAKKVIIQ